VSNSGKILGVKSGTCTITVASKKNTSIKKSFTLRVYEGNEAAAIKLSTNGATLGVGDTMTVTATVLPATSDQTVTWKSSDTSVLTVTQSGKIKGVGVGRATLTATSGKVTASASFVVMQTTMATTIPARTTDISGISANMARIEAIRRSAVNELMILRESGAITAAEYTDRVESVNRAFEMQAFPWMTTTIQEYWSTAYAYKRYKPGNVYYGLPYIQCGTNGVYTNRQYNVTKAVKQGYYTDSGKGYYNMSRTKFLNGMYVGNDCSAFVSMAMWGTSNNLSYLNTTSLATNAGYKTTYKWTEMRPGDFMVKSGNHTVMFLYYTDASRTKAMIIEQGGDGNTVICSIHDIATKYKNKGYIMRRKVTYK